MLLFKMNITLLNIHSLLFIICILFLVYTTSNSLIKFLGDKKYTFLDFRISLFVLIFLLINVCFSSIFMLLFIGIVEDPECVDEDDDDENNANLNILWRRVMVNNIPMLARICDNFGAVALCNAWFKKS